MKKILAACTAVVMGAALAVAAVLPASAHHPEVSGVVNCNPVTGNFDITWTVQSWDTGYAGTVTQSSRDVVPVGTVIGTPQVFKETVTHPGTHNLKVWMSWDNNARGSSHGSVKVSGDCTTQPEDKVVPGTAVDGVYSCNATEVATTRIDSIIKFVWTGKKWEAQAPVNSDPIPGVRQLTDAEIWEVSKDNPKSECYENNSPPMPDLGIAPPTCAVPFNHFTFTGESEGVRFIFGNTRIEAEEIVKASNAGYTVEQALAAHNIPISYGTVTLPVVWYDSVAGEDVELGSVTVTLVDPSSLDCVTPFPTKPVWTDECGVGNGKWTQPEDADGIVWSQFTKDGKDYIRATNTNEGYTFPNKNTIKQWSAVQDDTLCPIPTEVVFTVENTVGTCDADGTLPEQAEQEGITFEWDREFNGPGNYTLTGTAEFPFVLDGEASKTITVGEATGFQNTDADAECYKKPVPPVEKPEAPKKAALAYTGNSPAPLIGLAALLLLIGTAGMVAARKIAVAKQ